VPSENQQFLAAGRIPHPGGVVCTPRDNPLPVRRIGHGKERLGVSSERFQLPVHLPLPVVPLEPTFRHRRRFLQQLSHPADVVLFPPMLHYIHVRHIEMVLGPAPLPHYASQARSPDDVQENNQQSQQRFAPAETSRDQWWRCFFADSEDAQLICSSRGEILDANRHTVQLLGLNHGVISANARSIFDFLTGVAAIKLEGWLVQRGKGQRSIGSVTLNCEGKLSHLVDLRFLPLDDDHFLLTIKDASSRWRMESHVQRLLTAVDATPDVVFLTDTKFRLTFVNSAFQTVTGYGLEEALGRTADFLRAPDQHNKTAECLESMRQGLDWRGEFINLRHDGTSYPIEASISPIYDKEGGFLGYAAFERDITQQKKLQHELELERNAVVSIINSIESAVYTMDREFRLSHINDGWKKMPSSHGWLTLNEPPQIGRALLDYVIKVTGRERRHWESP
jgi:PAS domain S-box-containing protein